MKNERELIEKRIEVLGLKKKYVAQKCNIHPVTFSYFLNGKKDLKDYELNDLLVYLSLKKT